MDLNTKANINREPCNAFDVKTYVIGAAAAAFIVYFIAALCYFTNDTLNGPQSVEKLLDMPIIGDIPNFNASKSKKRKYYKYYIDEGDERGCKKGGRSK